MMAAPTPYLLRRISDGFYVANRSRVGYTFTLRLEDAQLYPSEAAAEADKRPGERAVPLQDVVERIVS